MTLRQRWDIADGLPDDVRDLMVYVDGDEVRAVRAYDVEEGWVRCLVLNPVGIAQVDPEDRGRAWEITLRGTVTLARKVT